MRSERNGARIVPAVLGIGRSNTRFRLFHFAFLIPHFALTSSLANPPPSYSFSRLDTLFLTAATGEPRFQAARDSSEGLLRAGSAATLDWLVDTLTARPDRPLTPRQRHYVERLFTVIGGSGREPAARGVLARAVREARDDTARAQWLYIGSRIGDTAFRAAALPWTTAGSEAVRRMAFRSLGAYPHPDNAAVLWTALGGAASGLERHMVLWALAQQAPGDIGSAARLAPLLQAPEAYNRRLVRDLMLKATDSSWTTLAPFMPRALPQPLRREWWLLARDARGGDEFLRAEARRMTEEEKRFFSAGKTRR